MSLSPPINRTDHVDDELNSQHHSCCFCCKQTSTITTTTVTGSFTCTGTGIIRTYGRYKYHITGHVAYSRIQPLLVVASCKESKNCVTVDSWTGYPFSEISVAATAAAATTGSNATGTAAAAADDDDDVISNKQTSLHFLWENTPRSYTKNLRDTVTCYSHLPNGTAIYDSKYALGRLMRTSDRYQQPQPQPQIYVCNYQPFVALTTHCFRGRSGYRNLLSLIGLRHVDTSVTSTSTSTSTSTTAVDEETHDTPVRRRPHNSSATHIFLDLMTYDFSQSSISTGKSCDDQIEHDNILRVPTITTKSLPDRNQNDMNLWVVKDAYSNGAGGIWVLGHDNSQIVEDQLYDQHAYVAQQYVYPMVLFRQRKCHVRVYALITSDNRAFVHHQCFVHVANDRFTFTSTTGTTGTSSTTTTTTTTTTVHPIQDISSVTGTQSTPYHDSVHITNCCANSHNPMKFAGEICADLNANQHRYRYMTTTGSISSKNENDNNNNDTNESLQYADHNIILGLQPFASSIYASVERLVQVTAPFVQGGQHNHGFEYLGLDFILSYNDDTDEDDDDDDDNIQLQPLAYLLEVNAPPSQDTATKLPHAEEVHNTVLRDLLNLWVYPHIIPNTVEQLGGWYCVYDGRNDEVEASLSEASVVPSKAAILNKIRWNLFERQQLKLDQKQNQRKLHTTGSMKISTGTDTIDTITSKSTGNDSFANFTRRYYPYYQQEKMGITTSISSGSQKLFFENAGGTQVPEQVIQCMNVSLSYRHRCVIGTASVQAAKDVLSILLGASPSTYDIYFGSNASTLLNNLGRWYLQTNKIQKGDEILIQTENHIANVSPWTDIAAAVGATVRWWDSSSMKIVDLLSPKTRVVAVSHASNILGQGYNHKYLRQVIDEHTKGYGHIVVDGVTYVPHRYAAIDECQFDWYVISCHKLFGPHLGVLCGRRSFAITARNHNNDDLDHNKETSIRQTSPTNNNDIQFGTVNYEACAGVRGLGRYFVALSTYNSMHGIVENSDHTDVATTNYSIDILLNKRMVFDAYQLIASTETVLVQMFLHGLQRSTKIRIIEGDTSASSSMDQRKCDRLPIISFVHATIPSKQVVDKCYDGGVVCRSGTFLSTERLQQWHSIRDESTQGVVRFSMAHYNTCHEVQFALNVLESIPGWM